MASDFCVIIPAYNAFKTIKAVVEGALKYTEHVYVADDGSADNTAEVAAAAGAHVVRILKNSGKGNALKLLFKKAIADGFSVAISIDADGQHDPDEIPKFLKEHEFFPNSIIVGSRMHDKEKIPTARYNSMRIARFYISLVANQFLVDTQSGYRLYPLNHISKINLCTERYVTETEILMKAGDSGIEVKFVDIKTIYGQNESHFRPIADIAAITTYVIFYLHFKWFAEGISSSKPNTYSGSSFLADRIMCNNVFGRFIQSLTVLTALPATVLFLIEYYLLDLLIPNNFASVRKLGVGFVVITMATQMLPVLLIVVVAEKVSRLLGINFKLIDGFICRFYPNLWKT